VQSGRLVPTFQWHLLAVPSRSPNPTITSRKLFEKIGGRIEFGGESVLLGLIKQI